jgi:hypothetical protein
LKLKSLNLCQAFLLEQVIGPGAAKLVAFSVNRGKALLRIGPLSGLVSREIPKEPGKGQKIRHRQILPEFITC